MGEKEGEMKKTEILLVILLFPLMAHANECDEIKPDLHHSIFLSAEMKAEDVFKACLASPIPESVTELRGGGEAWMEWDSDIIFKIDAPLFKCLVSGYEILPNCISENLKTSRGISSDGKYDARELFSYLDESFSEKDKHDLKSISGLKCYYKEQKEGGWKGYYFLYYDESNHEVYFHAYGD
jgi:hypothetical protein